MDGLPALAGDALFSNCLQEDCNSTWINTGDLPALVFLRSLQPLEAALVITSIVIAVTSNILFAVVVIFLYKRSQSLGYVKLSATLLALYPVYENLSCIALTIPRALQFMGVLIGAYTMIVFNDFTNMLAMSSGGLDSFIRKMDGQPIEKPKCCACLPQAVWSKKRIFVTRMLIRQGKLVQYIHVILAASLLLNGNYSRRPLELNGPLFWITTIAGLSRAVATISMVWFVRSSIQVLTGSGLGKKFVALQVINIVHLIQNILFGFLEARDLPLQPYGLVSTRNRLSLYRYFSLIVMTSACQIWSAYLFYKKPVPIGLRRPQSDSQAGAINSGSAGNDVSFEEASRGQTNWAV